MFVVEDHAILQTELARQIVGQFFRGDDERPDGDDLSLQRLRDASCVAGRCHQNGFGLQRAASRFDDEALPAPSFDCGLRLRCASLRPPLPLRGLRRTVNPGDARPRVERGPRVFRGPRQFRHELRGIQSSAHLVHQRAVIRVRADLALHFTRWDKVYLVVELLRHELGFVFERVEMFRFVGRQQVTRPRKAAVNLFLAHDLFHRVYRIQRALK